MTKITRIGIFYGIFFAVLAAVGVKTAALAQETANLTAALGRSLKDFSQLSDENKKNILSAAGLPQINNFSMAKISAYIIFGAIGFAAFVYGKKKAAWRPMVMGIALMIYPYLLSGTPALYLIGLALTAALYFWRE
jgi:hypothetical protein